MLVAASNAVIRALLAPLCAACDRPLDDPLSGPICDGCLRDWRCIVPPMCARCGDQLPAGLITDLCARCASGETTPSRIASAGIYDGALKQMIHALKYRKRRMIAPLLARRIRVACADVLREADAAVPVPLHFLRRWDRGFNQAEDIADALGLPVWKALRRQRHGPPQASLPAHKRHGNASGSYALARIEPFRGRELPRLRDARVVLVDDVVTTGATLDACANVLYAAGAARVTAVTAARAVAALRPRQPPAPRLSLVRRR